MQWLGSRAKKIVTAIEQFGKHPSPELQRFLRPQEVLIAKLDHDELSHQDRSLIGQKLAEFGDTRPGVGLRPDDLPDILWSEIPGGQVRLKDVKHVFNVKPFRMAKYPATNEQFEVFLKAEDGYRNEEWWEDIKQSDEASQSSWREANAPREMVSWDEAVAFCRWLSVKTGDSIRLPTEWEWQQAATGGDPERPYPWTGWWDSSRCKGHESQLSMETAVGMYPQGATEQGVLDMTGNVWEWCPNTIDQPDPTITTVGRRVVRGGSWDGGPGSLRASARGRDATDFRFGSLGFRLVQDSESLTLCALSFYPLPPIPESECSLE